MSRMGVITVECDNKQCYAVETIDGDKLPASINVVLVVKGWQVGNGRDICPQCVEEGKA